MSDARNDTVVSLDTFRKPPQSSVWRVPEVFRLTGYEFDLARGNEVSFPVASNRPSPTFYTLYDKSTHLVAQPRFTHITKLDPLLDDGSVIIRHHTNADRAYGFTLSQVDLLLSCVPATSSMYSTEVGLFTLTHYTPVRGAPNHLLTFVRTRPDLSTEELLDLSESADEYLIYLPDGTMSTDPGLLYPDYK